MKTLELENGDKSLEVDIYDDGDIEITVYQEHYSWNDGGKAIAGDIILTKAQALELVRFLACETSEQQKDSRQCMNNSIPPTPSKFKV